MVRINLATDNTELAEMVVLVNGCGIADNKLIMLLYILLPFYTEIDDSSIRCAL